MGHTTNSRSVGSSTGSFQVRLGQCPVKNYNELLHLIELQRVGPTPIIGNAIKIQDEPESYKAFDDTSDGVANVVIKF